MKKLITALATPYINGEIDLTSYASLLRYQQENGVYGIVVASTTGEGNLLTSKEKLQLFNLAKQIFKGEIWVNVVDSFSPKACNNAKFWASNGADGILVSPPSFCKCTAQGYVLHVTAIFKAAECLPIMLYNVPSRAAYALNFDAVKSLTDLGNVSIKDAGADIAYTQKCCEITDVFCGNDEKLSDFVTAGASGVVSVVSNVAPKLTQAVLEGEHNDYFVTLSRLSMQEVSPIAIKYMLYKKGIFATYDMRLPLTCASEETRQSIDEIWQNEKVF